MLRNKGRQQGFTLIEIIAVLIILGILALIAIPRYQDIVQQAREASLDQAIAEGMAQVNQAYARCLLNTNGDEDACDAYAKLVDNGTLTDMTGQGDYDIEFGTNSTCVVSITATLTDTGDTKTEGKQFCVP